MMLTRSSSAELRHKREWGVAAGAFVVIVALEGVLFSNTWLSLYRTWIETDTYNYGLIVPLISAAMLFHSRKSWLSLRPSPSPWGVVATGTVSMVWALGALAGIQTLQHFGVLALIPAAALAVFGTNAMRVVSFPFAYLLLATPFGEFLVPSLISWTADFSVRALEVIGIPVFRDGPYIRIPAGDFQVVKACSGIRYLLTAVVLGVLFAHFGFRSWTRRIAFMLLCVVAPIVANWIRATCIILIGHFSSMKLAAGVDHFLYGWVFFGVVMLVVFLIGNHFSDGHPPPAKPNEDRDSSGIGSVPLILTIVGVSLGAASGVTITNTSTDRAGVSKVTDSVVVELPQPATGWQRRDTPMTDWNPIFVGARFVATAGYTYGTHTVSVIAVYYDTQSQGAELVGSKNRLFDLSNWWLRFERSIEVSAAESSPGFTLRETVVNDGKRNRLFWSWYSIAGDTYANELRAKLAAMQTAVTGRPADSYLVALSVDYDDDIDLARETMARFLADHRDVLSPCFLSTDCD